MAKTLHYFFTAALVALLAACSPASEEASYFGTVITGADFATGFKLTDHHGEIRQLPDYQGKVVALFFGFTHCPDICPTTMADLAAAMKLMGGNSDEVQVLFVTVDPERDTPEVLAQFVPSFDSRFVGLTGTVEEIDQVAKAFKIFYARQQEPGQTGYSFDHSAGVYVYDKQGKIRIYLKYGQKPVEIAHDLSRLL
ncbi:MAG: SCO family protein [Betaproteobacteria bacterium HGW-Betaproteobacteria-2]|nr:MAG: SCO family protein [Betaproteobacteria bacterium HGW-Betaproteobacteria-2]